ncbi:MAG TPA: hypothetical protein VNU72_03665, partial [Puia sp.]|nr:hypothetical protein [Puia sp.]
TDEPNNDEIADENGSTGWTQLTADDADAATSPVTEEFATTVRPNNRDYSIGSGSTTAAAPHSSANRTSGAYAFVPNSSFSYQLLDDSTRPKEQLIYLQQFSSQELVEGVKKIQEQYQRQLKDLQQEQAKVAPNLKCLQQYRQRQDKLFLDYQGKLKELQQKMDKATRRLRIVYI